MDHHHTVLIANRGEVALRINATCQAFDIKTVAVYTHEDQYASYLFCADQSYKLAHNGLAGYLDQETLIKIALQTGATAIHPGYGFLSESTSFAQAVCDAGLIWIGPTPQNIALLASKAQAQKIMIDAGVPTIPGYSFHASDPDSLEQAKKSAGLIGYPVMLKCAHGGGGKAMARVDDQERFTPTWHSIVSQSKKLFNSDVILVEKQLVAPRHVEIQIAGDGHNYIHLYERECSIQRNNQKVIESAPCTSISTKTKQDMIAAALKAAQAVDYENIGTVEFLVTPDQQFYFLEMNTRLQVEHSVTELTTNIDLVFVQLHIAFHKELPYNQHEIRQQGHAIECRVYAEDPAHNFAPSAGTITNLLLPNTPFLRLDHDLELNTVITPDFDPMILKLTTWGDTREHALAHLRQALLQTNITGIQTNLTFLLQILLTKEFETDAIHTQLFQDTPCPDKPCHNTPCHEKNYLETVLNTPLPQKTVLTQEQSLELLSLVQTANSAHFQSALSQSDQTKQSTTKATSPNSWRNRRWN